MPPPLYRALHAGFAGKSTLTVFGFRACGTQPLIRACLKCGTQREECLLGHAIRRCVIDDRLRMLLADAATDQSDLPKPPHPSDQLALCSPPTRRMPQPVV